MKISNKIKIIFKNLNNQELKEMLQLMMDEKPEESGLLSLQENKLINKPVTTTNEQPKITLKQIDKLFDKYIIYAPKAELKKPMDILEFKKDIIRLIV
jgi:hypothetical protein